MRKIEAQTGPILSVSFSRDGRRSLSSAGDRTVRQWDTETGAELCKLSGHTNSVRCAVYSLDEKRIISTSDDGTIRIWNSDTRQTTYIPEIDQEVSSLSLVGGWIKSAKGELLLWVPPEYRNGLFFQSVNNVGFS